MLDMVIEMIVMIMITDFEDDDGAKCKFLQYFIIFVAFPQFFK